MPPRSPARRVHATRLGVAFAAVCGGLLAVTAAVPAFAHNYLVSSSPAAGSTQTSPIHEITLGFNDTVLNLGANSTTSIVQLVGPDTATHYETGCALTSNRSVTVPVALGEPGDYTVKYQIVSADGHTVSNSLAFTYQPPIGTVASPGLPSAPPCTEQAASRDTSDDRGSKPSANSTETRNDAATAVVIAAGVVVFAGIGVAVFFALWRNRKTRGRA
jgi:methionine-rich copper-binding protein CopC